MARCNSAKHDFHETPKMYPNLNANISNDQQFRLNKIHEIKDYFIAEIRERELMSYWSACWNYECKFWPYIFNYYRICKKVLKNNKK